MRIGWTLALVGLIVGLAAGWLLREQPGGAAPPALAGLRSRVLTPEPPAAPAQLQSRLTQLAAANGEPVGIAVTDVTSGWTAGVDAGSAYPQQSVSKLWVAICVMKAVDAGRISLETPVRLTDADRSVFFQPLAYRIGADGYATTIGELLRRALVASDNAANDRLMREVGGPRGVADDLRALGLKGVKVGAYERDLQARTAGLNWQPEYGIGWNFQAARALLPAPDREAALAAYLADSPDGAAPAAITAALAALARGELLSRASSDHLLALMAAARTGPRRLKGGLPPGWRIAHKTGTGPDYRGASVGINDVGLLTAPDGRTYAVAVMMRQTRHPVPQRLAFMQAITRAVAEDWSANRKAGDPRTD